MQRQYLKPKMVTPPGGQPVLARLQHPTSGLELRPDGGWVPYLGREGNWWRRRVAEGSAEIVDPTSATDINTNATDINTNELAEGDAESEG